MEHCHLIFSKLKPWKTDTDFFIQCHRFTVEIKEVKSHPELWVRPTEHWEYLPAMSDLTASSNDCRNSFPTCVTTHRGPVTFQPSSTSLGLKRDYLGALVLLFMLRITVRSRSCQFFPPLTSGVFSSYQRSWQAKRITPWPSLRAMPLLCLCFGLGFL